MSPASEGKQLSMFQIHQQLLAASIGGLVTAVFVCPFDLVKTRFQVDGPSSHTALVERQFKGTVDAFIKITRAEGVLSLWRGLTPALLMAIPNAAIYFNAYEALKKRLKDVVPPMMLPMISGSLARTLTVTTLAPLEFIRTNLQGSLGVLRKNHSMKDFTSSVVGKTGIQGLWRGLGATLMRDIPFSAIYWSGYEYSKWSFNTLLPPNYNKKHHGLPFLINFTSGAISGMVAAIITTPIDVIKTNSQVKLQPNMKKPTSLEIGRMIVTHEGWLGLTRGMIPRALKVAPACAIMISVFELIKSINQE